MNISATAPPHLNYSRSNHQELYAEAYPDRDAYEFPANHPNNKV